MLQFVTDNQLSDPVRGQVQSFLDSLGREFALNDRPATSQAAADLLAYDVETKRHVAAVLAELAERLPHDFFESGSEKFAAELRRHAWKFDPGAAANGGPYFSHIRRTQLDSLARELLASYFDARLTPSQPDDDEKAMLAADPVARAQAALAMLELMQVHLPALEARKRELESLPRQRSDALIARGGNEQSHWRRAVDAFNLARREHDQTLATLRKLFSKALHFDEQQALLLSEIVPYAEADQSNYPVCGVAKSLAWHVEQYGLTEAMRPQLESMCAALLRLPDNNTRRWATRLRELLAPTGEEVPIVLEAGDAWANQAREELAAMPVDRRRQWAKLLEHCRGAVRSKPSKAWLKGAGPLMKDLTAEQYTSTVCRWFSQLGNRKPTDNNSDIMRGLMHAVMLLDPKKSAHAAALETLSTALADLAEAGCRRSATGTLVSSKLATASVETLAMFPSASAVAQLGRLKQRLKADWIRDKIAKALDEAAERHGLNADDVEDALIPTCGFTEVGRRVATFGGYQAELVIDSTQSAPLRWTDAEGKPQKTEPARVKREFAAELKALKKSVADAMKLIAAQRDRLDRSFIQPKSWQFDVWRERYLTHPLVGTLARRLIWSFKNGRKSVNGIWLAGRLVDFRGKPIEPAHQAEVSLWHPLTARSQDVTGWREFLADRGVTQPFKQAHREVYRLTDPERNTGTYSNRFAGHILRQHQFNALREARGWNYQFMGHWDSCDSVPRLDLPHWQLSAEFWLQETADETLSPAGVLLYVGSDQVRFYRDGAVIPLTDVPPLVFSEVMRDVDLFVGVASIGNDPNWGVAGVGSDAQQAAAAEVPQPFAGYWQTFSFGELSEAAKTRASVLREIVPRLSIADRCSFDERFLVVRGSLRTYRIHLGSGNILMEPGSQYLCIVPSPRSLAPKVMLPFEGDSMLSVILSKALLLSADDKITDPSIRRQIERKA